MFTTLSTVDLALEVGYVEAIELAREGGFEAVDLPMLELKDFPDESEAPRFKDELARASLRAGGWWLPIEFREDNETYKAGLKMLPNVAKFAGTIGGCWCNTWIWPFSDNLTYQENFDLHVERLKLVASVLKDYGCCLAIEFVGPQTMRSGHRYEFISTMNEALELIDRIDEDNVGLLLDCWQWYTSHGTPEDLVALESGKVMYVHLNDAPIGLEVDHQIDDQRMLPGSTGVIDIDTFLEALKTLAFAGPIAVEPFNADVNKLEPRERVRVASESLAAVLRRVGIAPSHENEHAPSRSDLGRT